MNLLSVVLVYAGFAALVAGAVMVVKPIRRLGVRTRGRALIVLFGGALLSLVGFVLPVDDFRVEQARTRLDEFVPEYQFVERHEVRIQASPERVYAAMKAVEPEEIAFYQTLTSIRRFGRKGSEGMLNAPERRPLLETATRTGFMVLADEPPREFVFGFAGVRGPKLDYYRSPEKFKTASGPGAGRIAMNFRIEDAGAGACLLTTETRVYTGDEYSRGVFAKYWRVIYPGSAVIRRMWLRAIKKRAEA